MASQAAFPICVLMVALTASACSIVNPHVKPAQRHPWQNLTQYSGAYQDRPDSQSDQEFAGGMNEAISYANSMREAYYNAVGRQSLLRSGLAATLIPISATALFLGITDGGSGNAIAGLALGGAGLYGLGTFLDNPSLQPVYLMGSQAVGCAILSMRPFLLNRTVYNAVNAALEEIPGRIAALNDAIADTEGRIAAVESAKPTPAVADLVKAVREDIARARALLERAHVARANGSLIIDNVSRASLTLVTNVDNIRDMVSMEIARKESTLSSVMAIVNGLSSLSSAFAPRPDAQPLSPDLPARSPIELQFRIAPETIQDGRVQALIDSRRKLSIAYSHLSSSVQTIEQVQERMQLAQSQIDLIEQCRPKSVRTELTTMPPGPVRIASGTGTSRFIIQGGKAPYRAELLQEPVPGLDVRERPAFSAHIEVTAKNAAAGPYSILITDGAGITTVVGLEIGAAAGPPTGATAPVRAPQAARPTPPGVTTPPGPAAGPSPTPLPPPQQPEDAFLSEDQQKTVQRRLCVRDDGDFGNNTRRAIREYQDSVGKPPSGVLDREQAEAILNLQECPRQFQTYYEFSQLRPTGAVADLQRRINEANNRGIITLRRPLAITDELNASTREALKSFQVKSGVSPADGLYSLRTLQAISQIPPEGSSLSPDR